MTLAIWTGAEAEGRIETGEGIAIVNEGVTPGQATVISRSNDRHHRVCPALALVTLRCIELIRMALLALLARLRSFPRIGGRIILDLPHPVTGIHIHPGHLTGTGLVRCEMNLPLDLRQNESELEAHLHVDEAARSRSVAPPLANMEIDVSIARHREAGVGSQDAVRPGDVLLVGDEIAVGKTAAPLVLRENGQDHLFGIEDLEFHRMDVLAHPAAMSTVIGIRDVFLDHHLGFRCGLQIQGHHLSPKLAPTKQ